MLITSILFLLCSNAVVIRRDKSISYGRSTIGMLLIIGIVAFNNFNYLLQQKMVGIYNGLFHISVITQAFHTFIFTVTLLILQFNSFYPRKVFSNIFSFIHDLILSKITYYSDFILNKKSGQFAIIEYPLVLMFAVIGGASLISCCDFMSVFLSIELQSYGLYILCTIYKDSEKATSAGLTYFLLGGLSSCFILLSSGLFYANSGTTSFDSIYLTNSISISGSSDIETVKSIFSNIYIPYYITFSLITLSVGFLFKITAAPLHSWSPDVYDGIPTIVTTFVAIFAKICILVVLLELVNYTTNLSYLEFNNEKGEFNTSFYYYWTITIMISSLLSLIVGSIAGLTQSRIKRLLAYSTISHIGFILLALAINTVESIQSFIFYLIQYSLANLNTFIILVTMGFSLYLYVEQEQQQEQQQKKEQQQKQEQKDKKDTDNDYSGVSDKYNSPIQLISQLQGYLYINPVLTISLALTLFSLIGIPPLIGFFAKLMVLSSAINSGYIFMTLIAVITSVIGAYYYLVVIKQMFFNDSNYTLNITLKDIAFKGIIVGLIAGSGIKTFYFDIRNITLSSTLTTTISILTGIIGLFLFSPQELLTLTNILSLERLK